MTVDVVVKILAVVGGGMAGGLALGLLARLLMRTFTVGKSPRWSVLMVRLLGGAICAWLVALWLFGGGGSGIGGMGGWGFGSGSGKGEGENTVEVGKKDEQSKSGDGDKQTPPGETFRIEVLGSAALPEADIQAERWYRIETEEEPRLLTFADVKAAVKNRQRRQPPLRRLEIVLYKDSPDEHVALVNQLVQWGRDLNDGKMRVDTSKSGTDAPRK